MNKQTVMSSDNGMRFNNEREGTAHTRNTDESHKRKHDRACREECYMYYFTPMMNSPNISDIWLVPPLL